MVCDLVVSLIAFAPLTAPCSLGTLTGLLLIFAPDHLATLLTLTAGVQHASGAFAVGVAWGLGHSAGMLLACLLVILLKNAAPDVELWEVVGNYCAGLLMVSVGVYFIFREEQYLDRKSDGSYAVRGCCCSGGHDAADIPEPHEAQRKGASRRLCTMNYGAGKDACAARSGGAARAAASEATPLVRQGEERPSGGAGRSAWTAIVGLLQAMLCPSCLMGLGPAYKMAAGGDGAAVRTALEFLAAAGLASTLGVGTLAAVWTLLTSNGVGGKVSPLALYRGSCGLTILVGALWLALNACGQVGALELAEPRHVASLLGHGRLSNAPHLADDRLNVAERSFLMR